MINRTKSGLYFSGKLCYGTSNFLVCKKNGRKKTREVEMERRKEREKLRETGRERTSEQGHDCLFFVTITDFLRVGNI